MCDNPPTWGRKTTNSCYVCGYDTFIIYIGVEITRVFCTLTQLKTRALPIFVLQDKQSVSKYVTEGAVFGERINGVKVDKLVLNIIGTCMYLQKASCKSAANKISGF